jgi:hypothetical protein
VKPYLAKSVVPIAPLTLCIVVALISLLMSTHILFDGQLPDATRTESNNGGRDKSLSISGSSVLDKRDNRRGLHHPSRNILSLSAFPFILPIDLTLQLPLLETNKPRHDVGPHEPQQGEETTEQGTHGCF